MLGSTCMDISIIFSINTKKINHCITIYVIRLAKNQTNLLVWIFEHKILHVYTTKNMEVATKEGKIKKWAYKLVRNITFWMVELLVIDLLVWITLWHGRLQNNHVRLHSKWPQNICQLHSFSKQIKPTKVKLCSKFIPIHQISNINVMIIWHFP